MSVGLDDLALDSVKGNRVVENTLTGNDIKEITLGTVPKAASVGPGAVGTDGLADGSVTPEKNAEPADWHYVGAPGEPAFQNEWENYDTSEVPDEATWQHVSFRKDNDHVVHVRGPRVRRHDRHADLQPPERVLPALLPPVPGALERRARARHGVLRRFGTRRGMRRAPGLRGRASSSRSKGYSFLEWRTAQQQRE